MLGRGVSSSATSKSTDSNLIRIWTNVIRWTQVIKKQGPRFVIVCNVDMI